MIAPESELVFDAGQHRYILGGVQLPGVTGVLEAAGLLDYGFLNAEDRARCLERGWAVHVATERDDNHVLDEGSLGAEILGYVEAWRTFRRDYGFVPRLIEHRVFHPHFKYAGTLDRVGGVRDGAEFIVDIKSGVAPDAVRYQLAAYNSCLPHPRTRHRRSVELHSDSSYRVIGFETCDYQRDFNEFLRALETYKYNEEEKPWRQ
jgi:hypothetical protein